MTFVLDAAARAKHKLRLRLMAHGLAADQARRRRLTRANAEVEIDLTPAAIDNPRAGLSKPAGKPGKATFVVKPDAEGGVAQQHRGRRSACRSHARFGPMGADGSIQSATITQARYRAGDDFKADLVNGQSALKATVRGDSARRARLRQSAARRNRRAAQPAAKDLDLDVKIATVIGANKQAITGLELTALWRGGEMRLGTMRGRIGGGALTATGNGGEMRIMTTDAGALVRFARPLLRASRAAISIWCCRSNGDTSAGDAILTNFVLRDEPALAPAGVRRAAARVGGRRRRHRSVRSCASKS